MPSGSPGFVHLHVHTHYSLLDGATRISDLVSSCKSMNMPSVAITDHGNMFGAIEFYQAARKAGIKPILGMEAYIAPGDRRSREARGMGEASYHLLLLAENQTGYRNLLKLSSIAYREGFYYRPRIDREVLEAHAEGLICTSTCLGAEIPQALMKHDRAAAEQVAEWYLRVFGPERFFIELQDHGIPEQKTINPELVDIARRRGLGLVATNDVHYLTHDDVEAHDVLCCISTGALQSETDRFRFPADQFFLKSPEQMAELFVGQTEALANTIAIAERCNVEFDFGKRHTPVYRPPNERSPEEYLRELVYSGARRKYGAREEPPLAPPLQGGERRGTPHLQGGAGGGGLAAEVVERIDYELGVIASKGFSSYFLICWDFVQYARSRGIPCGARGSGCSAVVAYCLGLSQPDPLRYGLYFERFMDPDRDEMPDIDIDICQEGREEVIRYVREKYGHVAQIITFGTLKARAAIRDVCRVLGVPLSEADAIAKLVPEALKMTIDKALESEPELKKLSTDNPQVRRVLDIARRIEGLSRHAGVHAAGVVIAQEPLEHFVPIYRQPESRAKAAKSAGNGAGDSGATGADITQFDGTTVEKVGLLKMDFLGLRTLTIMERARQLIGAAPPPHPTDDAGFIDVERLNLADARVYEVFARGETAGIFQFESGGMRDVVMKMRPNRIEDLIAANALYRPGPMVNIDAYIARKHGESWKTPHPIMDEVLEETYGIIVYQEQVARLVNRLGGIERKRAFRLAKAISKKKMDMIEAERQPFVEGAVRNGVDKRTASDIFEQILPFGEYAFNKAHSTGYALIAYQTAYLKCYFPHEFMAAVLTFESRAQKIDQWYQYIDDARRMGIDVKPPDVNLSAADFTVVVGPNATAGDAAPAADSAHLRFGLAAIKGVGPRAVAAIMEARQRGGPFTDLFEFCERVDLQVVNRAVIEAMIKAGAFDTTGAMRRGLANVLDAAMQAGSTTQSDRRSGQLSMFGGGDDEATNGAQRNIPAVEWTESEMLAFEKAVLGFYVTAHPLTRHESTLRRFASADVAELPLMEEGSEAILGGMISRVRTAVTKQGRNAGSKLAIATFEDLTGATEAVIFAEELEKYRGLIAPEKMVFVKGRVDKKREEPSVRVSEVIPLEEAAAKLATAVVVRLDGVGVDASVFARMRGVFAAHRGGVPVYLELNSGSGLVVTLRCNEGLYVAPGSAFVAALDEIVGERRISVIGPVRRVRRAPVAVAATVLAAAETEPEESEIAEPAAV